MWKIKITYKDKSSCTLTGNHKEIPLELAVNYFNKYVADRISRRISCMSGKHGTKD